MPVDGGTTAGKADRPALKADSLAEVNTGIPNITSPSAESSYGTGNVESNGTPVKNDL